MNNKILQILDVLSRLIFSAPRSGIAIFFNRGERANGMYRFLCFPRASSYTPYTPPAEK